MKKILSEVFLLITTVKSGVMRGKRPTHMDKLTPHARHQSRAVSC